MSRKFLSIVRAISFSVCGLLLAGAAGAQNLPDAPGKAEFVHNCLDCHSAGMVLRAKKTPDEWRKNVDDMAARGSDGSKEDIDKVVVYLDTYFATDKPSQVATPPPATPMPQSVRPQQSMNTCFACRRPGLQISKSERAVTRFQNPIAHPTIAIYNSTVALTASEKHMLDSF